MSLVTYSDSESDTDEVNKESVRDHLPIAQATGSKRRRCDDDDVPGFKKPPPLPSSFTSLYTSNVRSSTNDDPTLHEGRQRQVPHVEGNWPSFIHLEWLPSTQDLAHLEDLIASITHEHQITSNSKSADHLIQSSLRSELGVRLPLHVSLSATLILTSDNKEAFETEFTQTIRNANLSTFTAIPSGIRWVKNFDGTRHFLILTLEKPRDDDLHNLLALCNTTAHIFGLQQLYARENNEVGVLADLSANDTKLASLNPTAQIHDKFHISIAWSLSKIRTSSTATGHLPENVKKIEIPFDTVFLKIGNQVTRIPLHTP